MSNHHSYDGAHRLISPPSSPHLSRRHELVFLARTAPVARHQNEHAVVNSLAFLFINVLMNALQKPLQIPPDLELDEDDMQALNDARDAYNTLLCELLKVERQQAHVARNVDLQLQLAGQQLCEQRARFISVLLLARQRCAYLHSEK